MGDLVKALSNLEILMGWIRVTDQTRGGGREWKNLKAHSSWHILNDIYVFSYNYGTLKLSAEP